MPADGHVSVEIQRGQSWPGDESGAGVVGDEREQQCRAQSGKTGRWEKSSSFDGDGAEGGAEGFDY